MNTHTNTTNPAVPAKAPLSTRIEAHIPGTEAHRERKYVEAQTGYTGTTVPPGGPTGFPATNPAHMGAPAMNTTAPAQGYNNTMAPTVPAGTTHTMGTQTHSKHGTTMGERVAELQGHKPDNTVPRAHMGDKVMGTVEAGIGRMTNNPEREMAGLDRKTYGDPKHYGGTTHGHHGPTVQPGTQQAYTQPAQQAYNQPAQQAYTQPQGAYPPPAQPPTGY